MAKQLGDLPLNAKLKMGSIYGQAMQWVIKSKYHAGYPASAITILTDKIIKLMASDAKESGNSDSNRRSYGNNRHIYSNIRQWLNKSGSPWYVAVHGADAPPNSANGRNNANPYEDTPGFLSNFNAEEIAVMLVTTLTVNKHSVDGGGQETYTDKMFLLSGTEVGFTTDTAEGSRLDGFDANDSSRIAYPTAEAVNNSNFTDSNLAADKACVWWVRTPYASNSSYVCCVNIYGATNHYTYAYDGYYTGVRVACNLPSSTLVSDTTDADGCYTLIFNEPPAVPGFITVPETIGTGSTPQISWGASIDPEGTAVGYILERRFNGGAWAVIYTGPDTSFTDSAIPGGNTSVQYRVKAYDSAGVEGGYCTSDTRSIVTSVAPGFSGQDGQLGSGYYTMPKPPAYDFSVSGNSAGENLLMTVKLDDVTIRTYSGAAGSNDSFTFTDDEWIQVLNGSHTLKIIAQNPNSQVSTRTLTFTKNVTSIEFIAPLEPFYADDMPTEVIIQVIGLMPAGTVLNVKICNNGYDEEPAWEDCTFAVQNNQKHLFTNTVKTALNWGVKVHVKLDRGSALGQVNIKSVGGNFK